MVQPSNRMPRQHGLPSHGLCTQSLRRALAEAPAQRNRAVAFALSTNGVRAALQASCAQRLVRRELSAPASLPLGHPKSSSDRCGSCAGLSWPNVKFDQGRQTLIDHGQMLPTSGENWPRVGRDRRVLVESSQMVAKVTQSWRQLAQSDQTCPKFGSWSSAFGATLEQVRRSPGSQGVAILEEWGAIV